jgi:ABC-type multidrug transport system fused ATPase/permease subunit
MEKKAEKTVDFKYNFKVYLEFLSKYKFLFFLIVFIALVHEGKQIVDKFIFKLAIDRATDFSAGIISSQIFISALLVLLIFFVIAAISSIFSNWFKLHFLNILDADMIYDLKQKYMSHLMSLDSKFYTTNKTGSLISRLNRGASAMERINDSIVFEFSPLILQSIVLVGSLIYLDKLSALIISSIFVVFIGYSYISQKKIDPLNVQQNKSEDIEKGYVADIFTNIDSIKYFGKEDYIKSRYVRLTKETRSNSLIAWHAWRSMSAGQSFIIGLGTLLLLYFSFVKFINGQLTLGTLTFIYTTYMSITGPMFMFVHGLRGFSKSMADFQDLFEYGKIESSIKDKPNAKKIEIKRGEIDISDISFSYGNRKLFENFSLKIPAGKKVALVGHSGCGKSSLIKLIYRLYDVNSGKILIDGKDIRDVKSETLRGEMAVVPQECILFDDSIFENIKFSNPHATKEEVTKAIKFAQLDRVIERFPEKENTIVGERGVKLSGGEKQRVSIARAILADKKILVLDEATSALDSETEYEIKKDLENLMKNRTSIIIAHRLSTIMHADIIVVMKNGKIVQMGKHSQLISQDGEYKKLWNLQKGGYLKE